VNASDVANFPVSCVARANWSDFQIAADFRGPREIFWGNGLVNESFVKVYDWDCFISIEEWLKVASALNINKNSCW
jgi:hypothetical protein